MPAEPPQRSAWSTNRSVLGWSEVMVQSFTGEMILPPSLRR
jgi:hypothetical protein